MEKKRDGRRDIVMIDLEGLVPENHLVRKIEAVMDYDWLYERLSPYYSEDKGRPEIDPVVLIKMALLEHLCGIASLRRTHREIGEIVEKTVSTTDPDCGMFVKGDHERQFAYEAHTACDKHGFVLGVEVTAGNIHDSVAWDGLYAQVTARFPQAEFITMDSAYKTPWIMKKILDDGRIPIIPYTRYKGRKDAYKPWDFTYDEGQDCFICPQGCRLRHTTTSKDGKRFYRSTPKDCRNCPCRQQCGANENGQRLLTTHIWQEYLDLAEQLRKTERGKDIYALRKETIERVFADAKDKHAMRYTHRRSLARVSSWVRLKFAALNLKKLALWAAKLPLLFCPFLPFPSTFPHLSSHSSLNLTTFLTSRRGWLQMPPPYIF